MQALAPLSSTYLPWTVSAMRPSGVVAVLNEIVVNRRRAVLELGGGVSSFYLGRLLRNRGGHLWTVEHDERWADLLEQDLVGEGLDGVVTVIRAPLTPIPCGWPGEDAVWYERERLMGALAQVPVDLLVIDGPPAYQTGQEHSRYPAVPLLSPTLADDYAIVLDDINRPGEQEIMRCWEEQFELTFERRIVDGGIGIGRPRPAYTV
ncbi:class I SAM-dependent methyltransferase [Plantactinospora soyae]|uniref:Uncharacterized protein n=1 Tax=Plantactinospora soyae TaxID=1544732 RepID=A0A927R7J2_9ACTN|nr:class I SAM-dependent methyltransferase [Plantactinospora soyae]MBE1489494.1 hypothetical protein [Plantactinospora soyae]